MGYPNPVQNGFGFKNIISRELNLLSNPQYTLNDSIQYLNGIRTLACEASSVDFVIGRKPIILTYRPKVIECKLESVIRNWIEKKLEGLKCLRSLVTILHTENTKTDMEKIFDCSLYSHFQWDEFRGCENSIVICMFSSEVRV